jgi:micrococcal nuclease
VYDGDTFLVSYRGKNEKVRIIGIDAPERNISKKYSCMGQEVSLLAFETLFQKKVSLVRDRKLKNRDHYGRLLRYVYLDDQDFGKFLLENGYARIFFNDHTKKNEYITTGIQAKKEQKGIFGEVCGFGGR